MISSKKEELLKIINNLINEAEGLKRAQRSDHVVMTSHGEIEKFNLWWNKVRNLPHLLGGTGKTWNRDLTETPKIYEYVFIVKKKGLLQAIKHEIENDHLQSITQMIHADTLCDLSEQADHLLDQGYYLAAGVIGRAVLEEHLRSTCDLHECRPGKKNATINDYNQALYKKEIITKTMMKRVDAAASIGNDAAHNKEELTADDVKHLLRELPVLIESI